MGVCLIITNIGKYFCLLPPIAEIVSLGIILLYLLQKLHRVIQSQDIVLMSIR